MIWQLNSRLKSASSRSERIPTGMRTSMEILSGMLQPAYSLPMKLQSVESDPQKISGKLRGLCWK